MQHIPRRDECACLAHTCRRYEFYCFPCWAQTLLPVRTDYKFAVTRFRRFPVSGIHQGGRTWHVLLLMILSQKTTKPAASHWQLVRPIVINHLSETSGGSKVVIFLRHAENGIPCIKQLRYRVSLRFAAERH